MFIVVIGILLVAGLIYIDIKLSNIILPKNFDYKYFKFKRKIKPKK